MPTDGNRLRRAWLGGVLAAGLVLLLAGCATSRPAPEDEEAEEAIPDPWEGDNRRLFAVSLFIDDHLLGPAAEAYRKALPPLARAGVTNLVANLRSPAVLMNDLLQGHPGCAAQTFTRIVANSAIGLGGLVDIGARLGIPRHEADFGQTLGGWGVGAGPYIFSPFIGPTNPRDLAGYLIDAAADPFTWEMAEARLAPADYARFAVSTVEARERNIENFDTLKQTSLDLYAVTRSLARQSRAASLDVARTPAAEACAPAAR